MRFAPALEKPVVPEERYFIPPQIEPAEAEQRIRAAIVEGTFRAPDAQRATIDAACALFVPFWRIDLERSDDTLAFSQIHIGKVGIPIPRQKSSHERNLWNVCARTSFPYEMKDKRTLLHGEVKPLVVSLAALAGGDPTLADWEIVDADLDADGAKRAAAKAMRRSESDSDVYTQTELTAHAMHFVRFPIWFARYRYEGVASPSADVFHMGISAVDGTCVAARHPSKLRAGAAKLKSLFAFGDRPDKEEERAKTEDDTGKDLAQRFFDHVQREKKKR